ncbi:MAG: pyruvate ferredoxin oxidoreductase [Candidatus Hydrogenedentes bacterium]|nr:pyruvate ferredoxin oxidoreductase [Candidatus Hydrogenedentota bacterium]
MKTILEKGPKTETQKNPKSYPSGTHIITGNQATAIGAYLSGVQVVAAYPITPQSPVVEELARFIESGELNAEFVHVESEHSAMSVCIGASIVGARVFTATSANGLAYMCEQLHWASGSRLPIVMACVNRAMAAPWSVQNDQQDSMSQRDAGWIQLFCRNNQEILDTVIQAFKIAEKVYLPVMVCYDGYILSHTVMPVEVPNAKDVQDFIPPYVPHTPIDLKKPVNINPVTLPDPRQNADGIVCHGYLEHKYLHHTALRESFPVIEEIDNEFKERFGRSCGGLCSTYKFDDAKIVVVCAGSISLLSSIAIDMLREVGIPAGLLTLRTYRPFPNEKLLQLLHDKKLIVTIDKSLSYGYQGPICVDLKSALFESSSDTLLIGYIAGLGGRDVKPYEIAEAVYETWDKYNKGKIVKRDLTEAKWINCKY